MSKLRPLNDKIILKRLKAESQTAGGIVLPDNAKEKPQRGVVIAVGPGSLTDEGKRCEMSVAVKDEVVFNSYAGTEIRIEEDELMVMAESDILAIIE